MVVIKKRSNVIPVDFGEFVIEFNANDANIRNMQAVGKKMEVEGAKLAETEDGNAFEVLHDMVKGSWVELFGEEAFRKVYAFSDETTVDAMAYLLEAISGVIKEWEQSNNGDALKKYLGD